jgi:hypothetical protein
MRYRRLCRDGPHVPVVGLGFWSIAGAFGTRDDAEAERTVLRAIELGATFFDTAPSYGDAEDFLGRVLGPARRQQVFLTTKCGIGRDPATAEAKISIYDRGFLYGDVVTESTRTFGLRLFKLREHLDRLAWSLKATEIAPGLSMTEVERLTLDLLARNRDCFAPGDDAWIVHKISRGVGAFGRSPGQQERSATVLIYCFPIDFTRTASQYRTGVHVVVPSTRQLPPECVDPKIKHRSRMHFALASREAARSIPTRSRSCSTWRAI